MRWLLITKWCVCVLSHQVISDSLRTLWTTVCQAPLSMGFPRQEYWSGLPFPSPGDLPNPGIEPTFPTLTGEFFTTGSPTKCSCCCSVAQSCPTLCSPMDCSTPGFPVLNHLLEFAQTHVHWVGDAIQPSHPLSSPLFLPLIFPSIRVFSNESALRIRWPKYWSFSLNIVPFNEHLGLISFRMNSLDLLAVQGALKSQLQHHSSKASILQRSAFFIV